MVTVRAVNTGDHDTVHVVAQLRDYASRPAVYVSQAGAGHERVTADRIPGDTFVTGPDGAVSAAETVLDLTTNVRGCVLPAAGVASVVTQPEARRSGHAAALLRHILGFARGRGTDRLRPLPVPRVLLRPLRLHASASAAARPLARERVGTVARH